VKKDLAPWSNLDFDPKVVTVFMICYYCGIMSVYFSNFVDQPSTS